MDEIRDEIRRRINYGNSCYYSIKELSCLLSKILKIEAI
jgi:hypothetical protein